MPHTMAAWASMSSSNSHVCAKGLWSRTVTRHVMKNAAPPVLTLMGLQFGYLLGGSVLVETVFSWPGTFRAWRGSRPTYSSATT